MKSLILQHFDHFHLPKMASKLSNSGYEFVIFSIIDFIPYSLKLKSLLFFLLLNPVETLRVWAIEQLNANYIFGPEYLVLKTFTKTGTLNIAAMTALFAMAVVAILLSTHLLKRREG